MRSDHSLPEVPLAHGRGVRGEDGGGGSLLTQTQGLDDSAVAVDIALLQVVEQGATLTYQSREGTLCAVVLAVLFHVLSEVSDTIGEERNLALGTTCVGCALSKLLKEFGLLSGI